MSHCSICAHENLLGARFCTECGARLDLNCRGCGAAVMPDQKFCSSCGAALSQPLLGGAELSRAPVTYTPPHLAQRILANRHALHGEKKQVTVLFCDIVGSTEIAGALGPEAMHELLSTFLKVALAEVHRFEGTVNQFLGDGFMAIFGAPLAFEDHASRAARSALAIQHAVTSHGSSATTAGWDRLQLRMGLNSGQVVVGAIGDDLRMDYTASGDTTNLAARLEALAAPGEIICGEATVRAAKGVLVTEPRAPTLVKGIAAPVTYSRLCAVNDSALSSGRSRSRFVGRETEIGVLRQALDRARGGEGSVIEIEGDAGVGKSRLMAEYNAGLDGAARVVRGHCVAYGRQAPNVPIIELVRGLCGIEREDAEAHAEAAIVRTLGSAANADLLGALLGLPVALTRTAGIDPATARGRTIQTILLLVTQAAVTTPVVLMIEDLHWADPSSLEFLAAIATLAATTRCLMVVTYRPGSAPPWSAPSNGERLNLTPLPPAEARQLADSLGVDEFTERTLTNLLTRAEGNPFFLEELVRAAAHHSDEVPGDVFDVLGARIDRLDPDDKDLLRIGAVIGREFALDVVEEVAAFTGNSRPNFERLVTRGFVEPIAGTPRFTFVHALTQEVAYNSMLAQDRKRLHSAVAVRLAANEQTSEEIARHYLHGLTPLAALPYLETSIARAIQNHTLEAAHEFFHDVLRLLEAEPATPENLARRIGLVLQQFPVFHFTHRNGEYAALIERYLPIVEQLNIPALRGPFLAQRGHRFWVAARFSESITILREAVAIATEVGDVASAAYAECMLTWSHGSLGEYDAAEVHGSAAMSWLEQCPIPVFQTFTQVGLLLARTYRGHWREALAAGELARAAGVAAQDDGLTSFGGAFWSFPAIESENYALALELGARAIKEAPTDYFRTWASAYMAVALTRSGQVEQGLSLLETFVPLARASSHIAGYQFIALFLAEARLAAGRCDEARSLAEELRREAQDMPFIVGGCERLLGEIALAEGDTATALAYFRAGNAILARSGTENVWCECQFGEGRALAVAGDAAAARECFSAALAGFERLGTLGAPERVRAALQSLALS